MTHIRVIAECGIQLATSAKRLRHLTIIQTDIHPILTIPALDSCTMTDYDLAQLSGACSIDIGGGAGPYDVVGKVSAAVRCGRIRSKLEENFSNLLQ